MPQPGARANDFRGLHEDNAQLESSAGQERQDFGGSEKRGVRPEGGRRSQSERAGSKLWVGRHVSLEALLENFLQGDRQPRQRIFSFEVLLISQEALRPIRSIRLSPSRPGQP